MSPIATRYRQTIGTWRSAAFRHRSYDAGHTRAGSGDTSVDLRSTSGFAQDAIQHQNHRPDPATSHRHPYRSGAYGLASNNSPGGPAANGHPGSFRWEVAAPCMDR